LRIVSYNILDGGEGRADPIAEVIEAQRPDVVALAEATDLTVIERIANRLKMDFVQAPGASQASALLSRFTIRDSINHGAVRSELTKSLLEATLVESSARQWVVGIVHLHAHAREADEVIRQREIQVVLEIFRRHRDAGTPHVLAGDFNANSPLQKIAIENCKESTRREYAQNGNVIPRRVIQQVLNAGYLDSLDAAKPDIARTHGTFSTQYPGQRVDYIFTHGAAARVKDAWIEYDRLAKYASDHFPIGAQIE
jgi:endonuclease/exonuclease/phosphatase family metal-dependent hydrolase